MHWFISSTTSGGMSPSAGILIVEVPQLVKKTPPSSVTWKDCANGSYQRGLPFVFLVFVVITSSFLITADPENLLIFFVFE